MPLYPWHKKKASRETPIQANRPRGCEVPPCSQHEWEQITRLRKIEQKAANCLIALLAIAIVALVIAICYKSRPAEAFHGPGVVDVTTAPVALSAPNPEPWNAN